MTPNRKLALAALLLTSSAALAGCGGGAEVNQHVSGVSQGQELADLKRALEVGAIDQANYDKLQKKIIKRGY
jgi:hypothetical protein